MDARPPLAARPHAPPHGARGRADGAVAGSCDPLATAAGLYAGPGRLARRHGPDVARPVWPRGRCLHRSPGGRHPRGGGGGAGAGGPGAGAGGGAGAGPGTGCLRPDPRRSPLRQPAFFRQHGAGH